MDDEAIPVKAVFAKGEALKQSLCKDGDCFAEFTLSMANVLAKQVIGAGLPRPDKSGLAKAVDHFKRPRCEI